MVAFKSTKQVKQSIKKRSSTQVPVAAHLIGKACSECLEIFEEGEKLTEAEVAGHRMRLFGKGPGHADRAAGVRYPGDDRKPSAQAEQSKSEVARG